ncbi:MAG: hypothetical protein Tsb009_38840 [Planctomycetaceae bacterium]
MNSGKLDCRHRDLLKRWLTERQPLKSLRAESQVLEGDVPAKELLCLSGLTRTQLTTTDDRNDHPKIS